MFTAETTYDPTRHADACWDDYCDDPEDREPEVYDFLCDIPGNVRYLVEHQDESDPGYVGNVATALLHDIRHYVPERFHDDYIRSFNYEWVQEMARRLWTDYRDDAGTLAYTIVAERMCDGARMDMISGPWDKVWAYADAHEDINGEQVLWSLVGPRDTKRVRAWRA